MFCVCPGLPRFLRLLKLYLSPGTIIQHWHSVLSKKEEVPIHWLCLNLFPYFSGTSLYNWSKSFWASVFSHALCELLPDFFHSKSIINTFSLWAFKPPFFSTVFCNCVSTLAVYIHFRVMASVVIIVFVAVDILNNSFCLCIYIGCCWLPSHPLSAT